MEKDGNVRIVGEWASVKGNRKRKGQDEGDGKSRVERASRGGEKEDLSVSVTTNNLFDPDK